jgi:hypothetical protein
MAKECKHGKTFYCTSCSKSLVTVYYYNQYDNETEKFKPRYHYSSIAKDKISMEAGIDNLKKLLETKFKGTWKSFLVYRNNPRELIETIQAN